MRGGNVDEVERLRAELAKSQRALAAARALLDDPTKEALEAGMELDSRGTFLVVRDWMRNELALSGCDLYIFAILFSFTKQGRAFLGGTKYLIEACGFSPRSVMSTLVRLQDMGLVTSAQNPTCGRKKLYQVDLTRTLELVRNPVPHDSRKPIALPERDEDGCTSCDGDIPEATEAPQQPTEEKRMKNRTDDWCNNCTEQMIDAKTAPVLVQKLHQSNNLLIEKGDSEKREEKTVSPLPQDSHNPKRDAPKPPDLRGEPRLPSKGTNRQGVTFDMEAPDTPSPRPLPAGHKKADNGLKPKDGPRMPRFTHTKNGVLFVDIPEDYYDNLDYYESLERQGEDPWKM